MTTIKANIEICLHHTLHTKKVLHEALSDTDYQTAKDLHKCFELAVEQEVRFQLILDRIHDGKIKS